MVPKYAFVTKGVGTSKEKLTSFEMALRNADIAQYNLVKVSSIMPPHTEIITKKRGLKLPRKEGISTGCTISVVLLHDPSSTSLRRFA